MIPDYSMLPERLKSYYDKYSKLRETERELYEKYTEHVRKRQNDDEKMKELVELIKEDDIIYDNGHRRIFDPSICRDRNKILKVYFDEFSTPLQNIDMLNKAIEVSHPDFSETDRRTMRNLILNTTYGMMTSDYERDRNGRIWTGDIWKRELLKKLIYFDSLYYMIPSRRTRKSWFLTNFLTAATQNSMSFRHYNQPIPPSTECSFQSVIHFHFEKPSLEKLEWKYHIDAYLDSLSPIEKLYIENHFVLSRDERFRSTSKDLNKINNDKKKLERVIKKGRKRG